MIVVCCLLMRTPVTRHVENQELLLDSALVSYYDMKWEEIDVYINGKSGVATELCTSFFFRF